VAYYPEWGIYGRNYFIKDVEPYCGILTDLVYAFIGNKADGSVYHHDPYAAT